MKTRGFGWLIVLVIAAAPATASARKWHAGVDVRTDMAARGIRADVGVHLGPVDWTLVLDPQGLLDGRHDVDVTALWWFAPGRFAGMVGHRTTILDLDQGHAYQEKALLGLTAKLPSAGIGWARALAGLELSINWVRHGNGLATSFIAFETVRHFDDLWNFSVFLRFEFDGGREVR